MQELERGDRVCASLASVQGGACDSGIHSFGFAGAARVLAAGTVSGKLVGMFRTDRTRTRFRIRRMETRARRDGIIMF